MKNIAYTGRASTGVATLNMGNRWKSGAATSAVIDDCGIKRATASPTREGDRRKMTLKPEDLPVPYLNDGLTRT